MIKKVLEENVIIHDSGRCSPSQIRALSYQAKADFGGVLDAIVIDYLQNLVPDLRGSKKDFFDVNEISSSIYELSKELKILVVALSQLNRISVTDRPTEANMSESDQIVRDADVIMLMHRKQDRKTREDKNDVLMLDIVKGRDIGTHELLVLFEPNTQRFISDIDERTLLTQEEWDNINNPTFNKGKKAFDKLYDVKY